MLTQHFSQLAGVDAGNSRHMLALEPIGKRLYSIPMTILLAIVGNDDCRSMDFVTLHKCSQTILFDSERRHAIVTYKRISENHQLTCVGRVGKALRIAHHGCIEHHLASNGLVVAKRLSVELGSIFQD